MTPENKLDKLKRLLELVDESISREEFVSSFKDVMKHVLEVEKKIIERVDSKVDSKLTEADSEVKNLQSAIQQAKTDFQQVILETKEANETTLASLRTRALESIDSLFTRLRLNDRFNTVLSDYSAKIEQLDEEIAKVPTTEEILAKIPTPTKETADEARDKLETLKGDNRLDKSAIKGIEKIEEEVRRIDAKPTGKGSGGRQDVWHTGNLETMQKMSVSAAAPTSPSINDLWVDIS